MKTEHGGKQIKRSSKEDSHHESSVNFPIRWEKTTSNANIGRILGHFIIIIETKYIKIDDGKHEFKVISQQATIHSKQNNKYPKYQSRKCGGMARIRTKP